MEKLLELLNEYVKQLWIWDYVWWHNEETVRNSDYFLTKKFWFIQWLVENDKIDLLRLDNRIALSEFNKVERVLMALSIEDNPIEFLISILK